MKPKYLAILLLALGLSAFSIVTFPVDISGHLKPKNKQRQGKMDGLRIVVKGDDKVLAEGFADKKGDFNLTFTPANEKSFDFYCTGIGIDTILLSSVKRFESDNIEMTLDYTAKYSKDKLGRVLCLKCRRADKVYPIIYTGMPIITKKTTKSGKAVYSRIYKNTYQEDCLVQPAEYYCGRDKVRF